MDCNSENIKHFHHLSNVHFNFSFPFSLVVVVVVVLTANFALVVFGLTDRLPSSASFYNSPLSPSHNYKTLSNRFRMGTTCECVCVCVHTHVLPVPSFP